MTAFLMIFQGRCGSTYLMEGLNEHPDIDCWFEYFSVLKKRGATGLEQVDWFTEFVDVPDRNKGGTRGIKTKLRDVLDREGFCQVLKTRDVPIIHLQRCNVVKQTVSFFNSMRIHEKTGDWNLYERNGDIGKLVIDAEKFDQWLLATSREALEERTFVSSLPNRILNINYEEMLRNEHQTFDRVFDFLDVAPRVVKGKSLKISSDRLREVVGNFDELYSRYRGTPYEAMFHEIEVSK